MKKFLRKYLPRPLLRWAYPWLRPPFEGHNATFLLDNAGTRMMNILGRPPNQFRDLCKRSRAMGADTLYLFLLNEKDGWPPVNPFQDGRWFGALDEKTLEDWDEKLIDAARLGLSVVFWCMPDDSPGIYAALKGDPEALGRLCNNAIERWGWIATGWCMALEPEEYKSVWPSIDFAHRQLKENGARWIGCHGITGSTWGTLRLPHANVHFHQYGWNVSPGAIENITRDIRGRIGRRALVAAEYNKSSNNPEQGRAAIRGGAIATGNGR